MRRNWLRTIVVICVMAGCERSRPEAAAVRDTAVALAVPADSPGPALQKPDTIDRVLAHIERQLAPITEWRTAAIARLRSDSGTVRADTIAYEQRAELRKVVQELTRPFSDRALQRLLLHNYRAPTNSEVSDSLISFLAARGVWPAYGEGDFYFSAREASLLSWLGPYVTQGFREFLQYATIDQEHPASGDASLMIGLDEVASRLARAEQLLHAYPESPAAANVRFRLHQYLAAYMGGTDNTPAFEWKTRTMPLEWRKSLQNFVAAHGETDAGAGVRDYLELLERNNYKRTAEVDAFIRAKWQELHKMAADVY